MTTPAASVDLTNCDREPIHIPGAIQPIGFLVALTADWHWHNSFREEHCEDYPHFGLALTALLGS